MSNLMPNPRQNRRRLTSPFLRGRQTHVKTDAKPTSKPETLRRHLFLRGRQTHVKTDAKPTS
jgi:hypothetical protein